MAPAQARLFLRERPVAQTGDVLRFAPPLPGSVFAQLVQAIDKRPDSVAAGPSKNYVSAVEHIKAA